MQGLLPLRCHMHCSVKLIYTTTSIFIYRKVQNVQKITNSRLSSKTNGSSFHIYFYIFPCILIFYFPYVKMYCLLSHISIFPHVFFFKICILISTFPNWFSTVTPSIHQYNFNIFAFAPNC